MAENSDDSGDRCTFRCKKCEKTFRHQRPLTQHIRSAHVQQSCATCGRVFKRRNQLQRHRREKCVKNSFKCTCCAKSFNDSRSLQQHTNAVHRRTDSSPASPAREEKKYEVEDILLQSSTERVKSHGVVFPNKSYLVKWKNYSMRECTWEPAANLREAKDAVRLFHKRNSR